jgi:hypothetical protein
VAGISSDHSYLCGQIFTSTVRVFADRPARDDPAIRPGDASPKCKGLSNLLTIFFEEKTSKTDQKVLFIKKICIIAVLFCCSNFFRYFALG